MTSFSVREWVAVVAGTVAFFAGATVAGVLYAMDVLSAWAGWALAVVAIVGLVLFVVTTVRALLRGDTEGVERRDAARASMVAILVIVVSGFAYSLLEAFAGLPRMTAAVPAALAGLVWMVAFSWDRLTGDEG
ncbi:hypothetical protein CLV46_0518 [Diaminobutyricimonas aerilata]|uniref:Uncharacterized protein n=1 Tax=Diaminobutyricimonas aerilata TaxID=1162967 RepID=A0A2M9CGD1_9MICO|nr:hypothetical protein [Diaminobutyricimonas aerilata]PJJ70984.1 hypothetical protein CLV46_0518 [Diaminobutyricimonas aerilata]